MSVTIEQIKELREATGVSMMACKGALEEAKGNFEEAITILRKKGEAKAADRIGKSTSQGVVAVAIKGKKAAMVKLLCETDFVARGEDFIKLANSLAERVLDGKLKSEEREVSEVKDAVLKMGENIQIGEMALISGEILGSYVHSNLKIGVVVALKGGTSELAKDIAMHAAATNPLVLSPDDVKEELVKKEKEIWTEQLKKENKPAEVIEKIMLGKEKKFREENALIKQMFVKNPEKTIEQLLKEGGAEITEFVRFGI